MTKEEIQKNSEHWYNKYKDAEKRIEELEQKLEQTEKDLADYQFNYPTIKELEKQVKDLEWQLQEVVKDNDYYQAENKRLEQQIEKMKCCNNCEIITYHNTADCGEPVLIDKSHGTYVCDKWELRR